MQKTLERIRKKLETSGFANEAAVSQGGVLPILAGLGWEVQDTEEVAPEWTTAKGRVDYALCPERGRPSVLVEVKQAGMFDKGIEQLLQYAFTEGVPMAVLTDGRRWSVYLPSEPGSYAERRVDLLDVVEREVEEVERLLRRYLGKDAVVKGSHTVEAKQDLYSAARKTKAQRTIPKAWRMLLEDPDSLVAECLIERVEEDVGLAPTEEDVGSFLREVLIASPKVMNTKSGEGKQAETRKAAYHTSRIEPKTAAEAFDAAIATGLSKAKNQSTENNYRNRWLAFSQWAEEGNRGWLPASEADARDWIQHAWPGVAAQTLTHDLTAIGFVHRALGHPDPVGRGSPARKLRYRLKSREHKAETDT